MELIFDSGSVSAPESFVAILGKKGQGEGMPVAMSSTAMADGISAGGFLGQCR